MKMLPKVRYKHDCAGCNYIGQHKDFDLYIHPELENEQSIIARHGDGKFQVQVYALGKLLPCLVNL